MGIFDNAKSILIGDKEVKSIEVDGGVIWEAQKEEPITDMVLKVTGSSFNSYNTSPFSISGSLEVDWGDGNTTTYTSGKLSHTYSTSGDYVITLKGTINQIKAEAFKGVTNLKEVIIPNSVTFMDYCTFQNCTGLTKIVIGANISINGASMCNGCSSLTEAILPKSLKTLDDSSFQKAGNLVIELPNGVTKIGASSFQQSKLKSIVIPQSVTLIGGSAFNNCSNLESITFRGTTPPTLEGTNHFFYMSTNCVIRVPTGSLSAYTSASGYPNPSTYTYEEY